MFVDTFIRRPILASVCSLVIILAGAIAIPTLPIAQFPDLAPPQVQVIAFYNGASAQTVETAVTTPLEQAINGIEGMQYMTSSSGNDGTCAIIVTFDITRDLDIAAVDVQNRISQVEGRLPNEVNAVGISVTKVSSNFVLAAGAYAENGEYDPLFISNYVDRFIKDELKRVPGVGDVFVFGERRYAMRLWLDPDQLAGRGITADEVVQALREQNVQVAAGQVGAPPAREGPDLSDQRPRRRPADRAVASSTTSSSSASTDGALVRVQGRRPHRARRRELLAGGALQRPRRASASASCSCRPPTRCRCSATSRATLDRLSQRFPPGLKVEIAFDTTTVVSESIREVVTTLLEAIGLVVLVMFLFLQNWRTTLIPGDHHSGVAHRHVRVRQAVRLLDQHADALRHHARHRPRRRRCDRGDREHRAAHPRVAQADRRASAASEAMGEVTGAVIATALVLAAVFVPVGVLPGHHRPALSAVRADDRRLDGDLGVQRADADAGAGRRCC